jgi:hypothetical protein
VSDSLYSECAKGEGEEEEQLGSEEGRRGVSIIWYDDEKVNGGRAEEGGQAGQVRVWMQAH